MVLLSYGSFILNNSGENMILPENNLGEGKNYILTDGRANN
jgi:hypothetical protein